MQLGVFALLQARREQLDVELAQVEVLREYWTAVAAQEALFAGRRVDLGGDGSPLTLAGSGPAGGH